MADDTRKESEGHDMDTIPPPTGTLFVLLIYLAVLVGMWGTMYFYLLGK